MVICIFGIVLGIFVVDCGLVLFVDVEVGVIGVLYVGWKGVFGGVFEWILEQMEKLGVK